MDYSEKLEDFLVHLTRLSLSGSQQDVAALSKRISKALKDDSPETSQKIADILKSTTTSPMKNATRRTPENIVPVDRESRLDLLLVEDPIMLTERPHLSTEVKSSIDQVILEFRNRNRLIAEGLEPSRTLLLEGPPGVGKTLTARWIAQQLGKPLYTLSLPSVMSSYLGRTGLNLNSVISFAKSSDGILFLDEFDSIAKKRDDSSEVGELKRLVTVLLQEIDNWPADKLLIAATNHANLLDPAIWRRFSVVCSLRNPNQFGLHSYMKDELSGDVSDEILSVASIALSGSSYSQARRIINNIKKQSLLYNTDIESNILLYISHTIKELDKSEIKSIASSLSSHGISQRKISEVTGFARDTLRKMSSAGDSNG